MKPRSPFSKSVSVAYNVQQSPSFAFMPVGVGVLGPSWGFSIAGDSSRDIFLGKVL